MVWSVFGVAEVKSLASKCLTSPELGKEHALETSPITRWSRQDRYLCLFVRHDSLPDPCATQCPLVICARLYNHQFPCRSHTSLALKNRCISSPVTNLRLLCCR